MRPRTTAIATILVLGALTLPGVTVPAAAQSPAQPHGIPNSLRMEHEEQVEQLESLAKKRGPVAVAASKLITLLKHHHEREREFILPPLTLLPALSRGEVTPDMRWALEMADRVKAENKAIYREHAAITDACNDLLDAALKTNNKAAKEFAEQLVADSLNDLELLLPAAILVGEVLRSKLPPP